MLPLLLRGLLRDTLLLVAQYKSGALLQCFFFFFIFGDCSYRLCDGYISRFDPDF